MRVDLNKYLFVGTSEVKERFFEAAQQKGVIHFIDSAPERQKELPDTILHVTQAIKIVRSLPTTEQETIRNYKRADAIANNIIDLKHQLDKLQEEKRLLDLEIARVQIFGNFSREDIDYIEEKGKRSIQFFCAKKGVSDGDTFTNEAIYIGSDHGLDYFITICSAQQQFEGMIEMKVDKPVGLLKQRARQVERAIDEVEETLKGHEKYNEFLHHALIDKMNHYNLSAAQSFPEYEMEGSLFFVEGWVPINKQEELAEIVGEYEVFYEEVAIEENDHIPTCLQNEGAARMGEDLVHIYDTPSATDDDPSLWVLAFFSLFFAFIVGDGGYGLIFLAVALYMRFKIKDIKKTGRRLLNLTTLLAASCIAWGVLTTSFFGMSFAPESPMQKLSLVNWLDHKKINYHKNRSDGAFQEWKKQYPEIDEKMSSDEIFEKGAVVINGVKSYEILNKLSDSIMLELALVVGMLHIILSFARYIKRNWAGAGWILFIIGGYLYFPFYLGTASMLHFVFGLDEATSGPEGLYVMAGGLSIAFTLSLIQNKLFGLLEIATLIQIFGDILSYLRLYALGLAGGIVSATVNELSSGLIFVFAILVIIIGHAINILLSIMGGVIHGLRLNFLEWYHYSFEGGGKLYNPLRKLEVD